MRRSCPRGPADRGPDRHTDAHSVSRLRSDAPSSYDMR